MSPSALPGRFLQVRIDVLVDEGWTDAQIAGALDVKPKTVGRRRRRTARKPNTRCPECRSAMCLELHGRQPVRVALNAV